MEEIFSSIVASLTSHSLIKLHQLPKIYSKNVSLHKRSKMGLRVNHDMSTHANGISETAEDDVEMSGTSDKTPMGFNKGELVRLLVQAADSLGYPGAARKLEEESGMLAMSKGMRMLRECLLNGSWDDMESVLQDESAFRSKESAAMVRFRLYEQKFLELLEDGQVEQALDCMRNQLRKWCTNKDLLHKLSLLFMCTNPQDLRASAKWAGKGEEGRLKVLEDIRPHISSSVLLQENRLEHLLIQALKYQKREAMYPFTEFLNNSLLEDLQYFRDRLPRKTIHRFEAHDDQVWYIQFSHNGKFLASASRDKTVIVWDMKAVDSRQHDSDIKFRLKGHDSPVSYVCWSSDDTKLLSISSDHTIRMWNMETGKCEKVFQKHTEEITACAWLLDNKRFVSGGYGRQMYEWDIETGDGKSITRDIERVSDLKVTGDGKKLMVITADKRIVAYEIDSWNELFVLNEEASLASLHITKDCRFLITNLAREDNAEMHLWDLEHQRLVKKFRGYSQKRYIIRGAFGGYEDMFIICGSEDNKVYMWHRDGKKLLTALKGHTATVNCVSWSPTDISMFASASDDQTVRVWAPGDEIEVCDDGSEDDPSAIEATGLIVAVSP